MGSITLEYITELLYISGVKFDRLPKGTRIVLAFCCFNYNCVCYIEWYIFLCFYHQTKAEKTIKYDSEQFTV